MLINHSSATERVKQILTLAEAAAQARGHDSVHPAHLALGLIDEGEGVAATALQFHGFSLASLRDEVLGLLAPNGSPTTSPRHLELSAEGRDAWTAAQLEATALGHRYLGSEHLLLGLLSDPRAPLAQLFGARGFHLVEARARIRWILESDPLNPLPYVSPQSV